MSEIKVGERSTKHEVPFDDRIDNFRSVVGWNQPGVPPTFLTFFRQGEFELLNKFRIDLSSVLHGDQEYEYVSDLKPDQPASLETLVKDKYEKKGKSAHLTFLVLETEIHQGNELRAFSRTTMVIRKGAPE